MQELSVLHVPSFAVEGISRSMAGLSEISLPNLKVSEKSKGLQISKIKTDREDSIEYTSSSPEFFVRYNVDPLRFDLLPFDLTRRKFDAHLKNALGSSLVLKLENQSGSEILIKLRLRNGPTIYSVSRSIASSDRTQIVRIPIDDFQVEKDWTEKKLDTADFQIDVIGGSKKPFQLKFKDSLVVESDPRHPAVKKALQDAFYRVSSRLSFTRKMSDALFNQALRRLFDPEIQKKAHEIVQSKKDFKIFLDQYELTTQELGGKFTQVTKTINGRANRPFFSADSVMADRQIPVETGPFALEHSALAHAKQLACLLYGATHEEANVIIAFASASIKEGGASGVWAIWDSMFDGPGNSLPSEPRFWRDRFEAKLPETTSKRSK